MSLRSRSIHVTGDTRRRAFLTAWMPRSCRSMCMVAASTSY